ncbi:MAG: hypothetical protein QM765_26630 [Myxococcales bacterium]
MGNVKGTAVLGMMEMLRDKHGEQAVAAVLAQMKPENVACVSKQVLRSQWYPWPVLVDLCERADVACGKGDMRLVRGAAFHVAQSQLGGVLKFLLNMGSIESILHAASMTWKSHYGSGEYKVVSSKKGHFVVEITGFQDPHPVVCELVAGWVEGLLEDRKTQWQPVEHPLCVTRGDRCCQYVIRWT